MYSLFSSHNRLLLLHSTLPVGPAASVEHLVRRRQWRRRRRRRLPGRVRHSLGAPWACSGASLSSTSKALARQRAATCRYLPVAVPPPCPPSILPVDHQARRTCCAGTSSASISKWREIAVIASGEGSRDPWNNGTPPRQCERQQRGRFFSILPFHVQDLLRPFTAPLENPG